METLFRIGAFCYSMSLKVVMKMHPFLPNSIATILHPLSPASLNEACFLRSIDREATTSAQNRAIAAMDPPIVSVEEGDLILKMGSKVEKEDLEKYSKFLSITTKDRNLLPKRIFVYFWNFSFCYRLYQFSASIFLARCFSLRNCGVGYSSQPGYLPFYLRVRGGLIYLVVTLFLWGFCHFSCRSP